MTRSAPSEPAAAPARELALVAALALLPQLPFLGTAVSLDGPVFLAVARRILEAPLDPFGFEMLWDPTSTSAAAFNRNPPLVSYYLAAWMGCAGGSEPLLHAALLPFPLLAALCFHGIARRLAGPGLAPVALFCASPAFVLLSGAFLLDVPVLALELLGVYALLRGRARDASAWQWLAGAAVALAGLTKYVGLSAAPLVAAAALLLCAEPRRALGRVLAPPLVAWTAWGVFTNARYGTPHFFGATDVIFELGSARAFWNQLASLPIYWGAALLFPIGAFARALAGRSRGGELAVACLLLGALALGTALPRGEPPRRVALALPAYLPGAVAFASGAFLGLRGLLSIRRADPVQRWLWLWLAGMLVFSACVNWHVNAADALLVAPPLLLLWARDPELRPAGRGWQAGCAAALAFSLALASAEAQQANVYRDAARSIAREIGAQPGRRWFAGHWGLQHYLEAEGFRPIPPTAFGPAALAQGDWVVSARNVSQLEVARNLARYEIRPVWSWSAESALPLRTENADAGAGFYSHHTGYLPFAFSRVPLDVVALGRVTAVRTR